MLTITHFNKVQTKQNWHVYEPFTSNQEVAFIYANGDELAYIYNNTDLHGTKRTRLFINYEEKQTILALLRNG